MRIRLLTPMALLTVALAGCAGEPVDVAGDYSMAITNGANGCEFESWTEGETATGIPVRITQDDIEVTAEVQGLVGGLLELWLGARVFSGEVRGRDLELTLYGTNSFTEGNCVYTLNSTLKATVDGDLMSGQIRYEAATVGNPDCASLQGCATIQNFNGTRPPR